ncbi:phosphoribosylformylglycinamidine cyclo-ligase [Sandaracinus amylolyticus]|uniref:phosphoribosylformylglycinamidine cyclo-ligase n=1 Tax=Sandaracinus amylolyticus TaxID=927083 RepID=UPI001F015E68|nr:phosphoribosylformylglycinamidine cyclo-ligase [Sandaracinus amylolyticus]UJR80286.1 Phosphoribosylformylglycinamidine cyclo-ligase [Sandaracinus amylolyticus]
MAGITYKDSGVDVDAGDELVERIKPFAARTRIPEVLSGVGGFAGLCGLPTGMKDPVLVSGTDGVGTKLKLAFLADRHDTVGIDLVAMCVNDVVTTGARPLFFLDYFATGKLDVARTASVIQGIAKGCEDAGCALLGGETAELPGFYAPGEYDLAGFSVGVVERSAIIDGKRVASGDAVIGVASSGLHSNGYSLVRKVLLDHAKLALDSTPDGLGEPLVDALLRPTRIYARAVRALLDATIDVRALSHITGGGLPGNIPRVLPDDLGVAIDASKWTRPAIFDLVQRLGGVSEAEMRRAFNIGLGLVVVVPQSDASRAVDALNAAGERASIIGRVIETPGVEFEDRVQFVAT